MAASGSVLYGTWTDYGLYKWEAGVFVRLSSVLPTSMIASGSTVYANYPAYGGVWKWSAAAGGWSFLSGGPGSPPVQVVGGN